MATVTETIEEKIWKWPAAQRIRLAEKLLASVDDFATPDIEAAWNKLIETRVMEIRESHVAGIPADE